MLERKEFLLISQMPLAEDSRSISLIAKQFRYRLLLFADAIWRTRIERIGEADTVRITACQQTGTRCATDGLSGQEMSKADSLGCHTVDVRRFISVCPVIGEVPITRIVEVDDDKICVICREAGKSKA